MGRKCMLQQASPSLPASYSPVTCSSRQSQDRRTESSTDTGPSRTSRRGRPAIVARSIVGMQPVVGTASEGLLRWDCPGPADKIDRDPSGTWSTHTISTVTARSLVRGPHEWPGACNERGTAGRSDVVGAAAEFSPGPRTLQPILSTIAIRRAFSLPFVSKSALRSRWRVELTDEGGIADAAPLVDKDPLNLHAPLRRDGKIAPIHPRGGDRTFDLLIAVLRFLEFALTDQVVEMRMPLLLSADLSITQREWLLT